MSDEIESALTSKPPILADQMALKIDGPAVIFIRPREWLPNDTAERVTRDLNRLSHEMRLGKFVLVPPNFDIMAVGDVELEHYGLRRISREEPSV